jgi:hypothetical protein
LAALEDLQLDCAALILPRQSELRVPPDLECLFAVLYPFKGGKS